MNCVWKNQATWDPNLLERDAHAQWHEAGQVVRDEAETEFTRHSKRRNGDIQSDGKY